MGVAPPHNMYAVPASVSFFFKARNVEGQPRERTPELKYYGDQAQPRGAARPGTALREPMYMDTRVLCWCRVRDGRGSEVGWVRFFHVLHRCVGHAAYAACCATGSGFARAA